MALTDTAPESNIFSSRTPYIQPGKSLYGSPLSLDLDEMYGKKPETGPAPFEPPAVGNITAGLTPGPITPTTGLDMGQWLESSPDWQRLNTVSGEDTWVPTNAESGELYLGPSGILYEFGEGKWTEIEATSSYQKLLADYNRQIYHVNVYSTYVRDVIPNMLPSTMDITQRYFAGEVSGDELYSAVNGAIQARKAELGQWAGRYIGQYTSREDAARITEAKRLLSELEGRDTAMLQAIKDREKTIQDLEHDARLFGIDIDTTRLHDKAYVAEIHDLGKGVLEGAAGVGKDIDIAELPGAGDLLTEDFGVQTKRLIDSISAGEVQAYDELGMLNADALREIGGVGTYLADAMEQATQTGLLQGDFVNILRDEEGNAILDADGEPLLDLSPELQGMVDVFDEDMMIQQTDMMKSMRLRAAERGLSVEDVIMTKSMVDWMDEGSMQFATQLEDLLMQEVNSGYTSFVNSISNMLRESGMTAQAETFASNMQGQMDSIMADFNVEMQIMAEQQAAQRRASMGHIFQGIFSAVGIALMILL